MDAIASEGLPVAVAPSSALPNPTRLVFFLLHMQLTMILFKDCVLVHSASSL